MAEEKKERKWWEKAEEPKTIWQPCKTKEGYDYYYNSQTGETSWEKPAELMSPEELDGAGEWWWIPDEKKAFVPGRVREKDKAGKFANATLEDGTERKVETAKLEALKKSSLQRIVEDLVLLDAMSPPLILNNLKVRYEKNQIYTNVGNILISVNPYQILPYYTKQVQEDYINRGVREMPPHVYNIAHDAFYGLKEFGQNQSIIISGESGAGKTEATKQCLSYLAAIAGSVGGVEKKILDANPILEAFGNAKTLRNDNSSRFGKFIQVFFSDKNEISASTTENYLLEKIRVVHQADDERNFHIFYQLTKAATAEERKKYAIGQPSEYVYIKTCTEVPTVNDPKDFADVKKSLKTLAFGDDEVESMFATVAAVVTLGNIVFSEKKGDKGMVTDIADKKWVTNAANLVKVDVGRLIRSLTVRELRIKGQATTDVILNPKEASDIRDALSKFLYGNMFDWIVRRINKAMIQPTSNKQKYIGILDIFGFEIFKHNSFEQLCINFTNEMLQQHFNQQTFKLEESVYQREKIKFKHVDFIDNQPMLDLITKRPDGVLPLLDEELVVPKGTDKTFVQKLHDKQGKNAVYKKFIKDPNFFIIKHYAGEVVYDTFGFLEKNRDSLTTDLLEMLVTSKSPFINVLFPEKELASQDKKASLSKQFQQQLQDLMGALNKTEPHYIRCVKPNPNKSPNEFNSVMSFEQLTYSGVFEAVSIRKQGFPFRLTHEIFAERYDCINKHGGSGPKDKCQAIVKSMAFKADNIQMGATMMLYRAEEHRALELNRNIKLMTIEINENLDRLCKTDPNKLSKDEKEDYFNKLARQVRQADEFRLKTPQAEKARQLLEAFVEARMDPETKRKLEVALKEMDQSLLETALAICDGEGYRTKLTRAARELLGKVQDAEGALAMASRELETEYLNKALSMCDEFKYNRPSVQAARQLLANIHEANKKCSAAMATKDHEELESALQFCDSFGYAKPNVDDARTLYRQVMDARSGLESAKAAVEQTQLEGAIAACDAFGYNSDLVEECRALCARVTRINQETDAAVKTIDEDHVKAVVKAADEINQTSEWIEYFRTLVRGKYEAFLDAQYKKAFENKTHERAIRLDIKRKDLFIQANGANFSIEKYKMLRDSKEWAAAKFLGLGASIGNLDERASTFLRWQKDVIHTPLVEYKDKVPGKEGIKLLKKRALTMFENIQKYMGQRAEKKIGEKMALSIADLVAQKELRSECYIWLIKQMNQNMQPETNAKAWELFAIFLSVFPPSADFENFLEYYFRQNASNAEKWKLKSLLRRRCYEQDSKTVVPSAGEIEGISSYMSTRLRGFTDPVVSNPSYADLLQPYSGGGGGGGGGDWKKEKDSSTGNFYYVNAKTGQSQWDKPIGYTEPGSRPSAKKPVGGMPKPSLGAVGGMPKPAISAQPKPSVGPTGGGPKPAVVAKPTSPTPAPSKWKKEKDPSSGEFYYINIETQTSQWDKPADFVDDTASPTSPTPTPTPQPTKTTPQNSVTGGGRGLGAVTGGGRGGGLGGGLQITPQMLGGRGRGSPAVAAAPAKKSPWKAIKDESSGEFYYFNEETNESTWDKPPGM